MSDALPLFAQTAPVGQMFSHIFFMAIYALIGGLLLQYATKWVCNIDLSYITSVLYTLIVLFVSGIIFMVAGLAIVPFIDPKQPETAAMIGGAVGLLASIVILIAMPMMIGNLIKTPRGKSIGFGQGCLISLILLTISMILTIGFVAIGVVITMGAKAPQ